jgi:hypothetical protein
MKTYGDGGLAPPFLTSALDGSELSASSLGCLIPSTHSTEGCVGPRSGLDDVERTKMETAFSKPRAWVKNNTETNNYTLIKTEIRTHRLKPAQKPRTGQVFIHKVRELKLTRKNGTRT